MNDVTIAGIASLPWIISPIVTAVRASHSQSLDDESNNPPKNPPLVSVVIPARNEARNIEQCLRSVLTNAYPKLEVIVVDDHSTDDTGDIARGVAAGDSRVIVIGNANLPDGWFGKQWACVNGAKASHGEIICFADADTKQSSDLITRSVNAIQRRGADLFSVAGRQELGSFWERLVQPQIFSLLLVRYGGTESVTNSPRATDKIANGQCLFVKRDVYESLGGHALVKSHVADDMMMAQRFFARGKKVVLEKGLDQLSTRMYTSLGELVHGWGKNVFAGGRDSVPMGWVGQIFFPVLLLLAPMISFVPPVVLLSNLFTVLPQAVFLWSAISSFALLVLWVFAYRTAEMSPLYALLSPLGAIVIFYIFLRAVSRGRRVAWKGREYSHSSSEDPA
ncbi:MAG: glycosyltransferase family 2 protein [Gemmatimonadaceae bacterium]